MCKLETADFRVRVASVGCGMGAAAGLLWGGRPHQQLASNPPSNHISDLEMNSRCKISVWPFSGRVWKIIWGWLCEDIVAKTHHPHPCPTPHPHPRSRPRGEHWTLSLSRGGSGDECVPFDKSNVFGLFGQCCKL